MYVLTRGYTAFCFTIILKMFVHLSLVSIINVQDCSCNESAMKIKKTFHNFHIRFLFSYLCNRYFFVSRRGSVWKLYIIFSTFQCLSNKSKLKQIQKIALQLVCRILLYQVPQTTLNLSTISIFISCILGTVLAPVDFIICWKK